MNWVDVTILTAIVVGVVLGLYWGLIRQLASTFGLLLAIWLAGRTYEGVANFLHPPDGGGLIGDPNMAKLVAFVGVVIVVSLLIGIITGILRTALNLIFLGWLDHVLGAVLGLVQMLLLLEVILLVAWFFPVPNLSDNVHASALATAMLRPLSGLIDPLLPPEFQLLKLIHPLP